jgi:putative ABC transport system substrate-binding protein
MSDLRRRDFITLLGGAAAAWPLAARAQQPERVRRIGVLMALAEDDPDSRPRVEAFQQGLEKLGWTLGRNLRIDYHWAGGDLERTRAAVAELMRLPPEVILAEGTPNLRLLRQRTSSIPIVFTVVSEPVAAGFVASLAHPGGNITGFTNLEPSMGEKWLELLKEISPRVSRAALVFNPDTIPVQAAADKFAVEVVVAPVRDLAQIEAVMTRVGREQDGGLILPPDSFTAAHRKLIVELAARYRVPAVYSFRFFAAEGGLISYGIDLVDQFRRAAAYVDRILKGEKPANLPVQQPTKFELVINLKTAKTLGIELPATLLARADQVIE